MKEETEIMDPEKLRIMTLAKEIFFKEGFYKTSMDSLAARLQISKKTFYKYWPSKDELVKESIRTHIIGVSRDIHAAALKDTDAFDKLLSVLEVLENTLIKFGDKWLHDLQTQTPELWKEIDEFRTKKMLTTLNNLLGQGQKEGLISKDVPKEIIITVVVSAVRAIVNPDFLYHNKYSYIEAVHITFDIFFRGILTASGRKKFQPPYTRNIK
jgi:AcrR family transcriptional regulator